jgi:hypothetical protein
MKERRRTPFLLTSKAEEACQKALAEADSSRWSTGIIGIKKFESQDLTILTFSSLIVTSSLLFFNFSPSIQ